MQSVRDRLLIKPRETPGNLWESNTRSVLLDRPTDFLSVCFSFIDQNKLRTSPMQLNRCNTNF